MNENYKKSGIRNFTLGQLSACRSTLNRLVKSDYLIPSEKVVIRSALLKLDEIDNIDYAKRQEIFGKINNFKKYKNGEKDNSKNL